MHRRGTIERIKPVEIQVAGRVGEARSRVWLQLFEVHQHDRIAPGGERLGQARRLQQTQAIEVQRRPALRERVTDRRSQLCQSIEVKCHGLPGKRAGKGG